MKSTSEPIANPLAMRPLASERPGRLFERNAAVVGARAVDQVTVWNARPSGMKVTSSHAKALSVGARLSGSAEGRQVLGRITGIG